MPNMLVAMTVLGIAALSRAYALRTYELRAYELRAYDPTSYELRAYDPAICAQAKPGHRQMEFFRNSYSEF